MSRRELALAGAFLALAIVILATQIRLGGDGEESAAAATFEKETEPSPVAAPPASAEPESSASGASDLGPGEADPSEIDPGEIDFIDARGPARRAPAPQKVERAAVQPQPKAPAATPAPRPAPPSSAPASAPATGGDLTAIEVHPNGSAVDIRLAMRDAPEPRWFRLDDPPRIAFDLTGATLVADRAQRDQPVGHPLLEKVRAAQNQIDPPKVRVVLEVAAATEVAIERSADGVRIRLTPKP